MSWYDDDDDDMPHYHYTDLRSTVQFGHATFFKAERRRKNLLFNYSSAFDVDIMTLKQTLLLLYERLITMYEIACGWQIKRDSLILGPFEMKRKTTSSLSWHPIV
jgi:hypothetical protein